MSQSAKAIIPFEMRSLLSAVEFTCVVNANLWQWLWLILVEQYNFICSHFPVLYWLLHYIMFIIFPKTKTASSWRPSRETTPLLKTADIIINQNESAKGDRGKGLLSVKWRFTCASLIFIENLISNLLCDNQYSVPITTIALIAS